MRYGSVCSGIEAASVAWESLGWEAQWYSEIEPFPSAVLAHRFPTVPNLGDMTLLTENQTFNDSTIDLLVGGTPCQSFSVAGLRKGLADPRGNLMLTFLSLAERKKPRWIVWENVPGVLSSNGGRDFATFLTALGDIGYGFAYRVLDAQYFGVAQRRRRVFVVAYLGDWRPCASVLFESDCLQGNSKESREKRKATPIDAEGGSGGSSIPRVSGLLDTQCGGGKLTHQSVNNGHLIPEKMAAFRMTAFGQYSDDDTASTLKQRDYKDATDLVAHAFKVKGGRDGGGKGYLGQDETAFTISTTQNQQIAQPVSISAIDLKNISKTLTASYGQGGSDLDTKPLVLEPIAIQGNLIGRDTGGPQGIGVSENGIMYTQTKADVHGVAQPIAVDCYNQTINHKTTQTIGSSASDVNHYGAVLQPTMAIRRLTPRECERLQGFPDDWTLIPYRNKSAELCPDGPRYKACGNSMAVPVMRWIGQRINIVEQLMKEINEK
jgi:DNA (cytosine-5)-methyltransferase 1